jgi:hypothetical protein
MFWRFERRNQPLLSRLEFIERVAIHTGIGVGIIGGSLGIGVLGYHFLGGLAWIDALVNASMILGGMGPVDPISSMAGKVFASVYALYSGIIFLLTVGIIIAPVAHRILHRMNLETEEDVEKQEDAAGKEGAKGKK